MQLFYIYYDFIQKLMILKHFTYFWLQRIVSF